MGQHAAIIAVPGEPPPGSTWVDVAVLGALGVTIPGSQLLTAVGPAVRSRLTGERLARRTASG
jgi:hypothetical protein